MPTSEVFQKHGMDTLIPLLDRKLTTLESIPMIEKEEILDIGKEEHI